MSSGSREPTSPKAWANFLSQTWGPVYPVDVRTIALDYSARFPDPISKIVEAPVGQSFEGALYPLPKTGRWAILYNPDAPPGRLNFTLGHELGHYLAHRHLAKLTGFECGEARVLGFDRDAQRRKLEHEADSFASYLLMPLDDFRRQVGADALTFETLRGCVDRYSVSMTAAALKWLEATAKRAVVVYAVDGFVLWARASAAARYGFYFPQGMELPPASLAARSPRDRTGYNACEDVGAGVWRLGLPCREMVIYADRYDATVSVLIFPDSEPHPGEWEEEAVVDAFDQMMLR